MVQTFLMKVADIWIVEGCRGSDSSKLRGESGLLIGLDEVFVRLLISTTDASFTHEINLFE